MSDLGGISTYVSTYYGGIGGGLLGFVQAGYTPDWLFDDRDFVRADWVAKSWAGYTVTYVEEPRTTPGILIGSPPCKRFSGLAVRKKDRHDFDPDELEYIQFIRYVQAKHVPIFVLENVPRIENFIKFSGPVVEDRDQNVLLTLNGYSVQRLIVDAHEFGVPQHRKRLFIIGVAHDLIKDDNVWTLMSHLFPSSIELAAKPKQVERAFLGLDHTKPNMEKPRHTAKRIEGFSNLSPGQSYYGGPNNRRLHLRRASPTITSHRTQYVHPTEPRTLTVRECARLMGFPDDFVFYGPRTKQLDQVGCSICPPITYYIALWLRRVCGGE